jgi:hypothetical protein
MSRTLIERWLHPDSIRSKLVLLASVSLLLAVMLVFALSVFQQQRLIQNEWRESLSAQARMIAINSQAAVSFSDRAEASRLLSAVKSNPSILPGAAAGQERPDFCRVPKQSNRARSTKSCPTVRVGLTLIRVS